MIVSPKGDRVYTLGMDSVSALSVSLHVLLSLTLHDRQDPRLRPYLPPPPLLPAPDLLLPLPRRFLLLRPPLPLPLRTLHLLRLRRRPRPRLGHPLPLGVGGGEGQGSFGGGGGDGMGSGGDVYGGR